MIKNSDKHLTRPTKSVTNLIAKALGCTPEAVKSVQNGKRGARKTELQQKIERVLDYRIQQNESLIQFCEQVKIEVVTPVLNK